MPRNPAKTVDGLSGAKLSGGLKHGLLGTAAETEYQRRSASRSKSSSFSASDNISTAPGLLRLAAGIPGDFLLSRVVFSRSKNVLFEVLVS